MQKNPRIGRSPADFSKVSLSVGSGVVRPVGVSLIAIYYVVSALIGLLAIFLASSAIQTSTNFQEVGGLGPYDFFTKAIQDEENRALEVLTMATVVALFLAGVSLAVGVGLWRLRLWAYYLALIGGFITLALNFFDSLARPITWSLVVGAGLNLLILLYLLRPRTRQAFAE